MKKCVSHSAACSRLSATLGGADREIRKIRDIHTLLLQTDRSNALDCTNRPPPLDLPPKRDA